MTGTPIGPSKEPGWLDCDVAALLAMTGLGSITTGVGAVTGVKSWGAKLN
jgi:hypothetical protein